MLLFYERFAGKTRRSLRNPAPVGWWREALGTFERATKPAMMAVLFYQLTSDRVTQKRRQRSQHLGHQEWAQASLPLADIKYLQPLRDRHFDLNLSFSVLIC